jgi:hypothetical protein
MASISKFFALLSTMQRILSDLTLSEFAEGSREGVEHCEAATPSREFAACGAMCGSGRDGALSSMVPEASPWITLEWQILELSSII